MKLNGCAGSLPPAGSNFDGVQLARCTEPERPLCDTPGAAYTPCCPSLEKFGWLAGVALEDAGALLDVESR
jgi:hypothetical protein